MKIRKILALAISLTLLMTLVTVSTSDDVEPMAQPNIVSIYPVDGATNVDHQLNPFTFEADKVVCNVTVEDPDGDSMDVTFATNATGSWTNMQTNSSVGNGTYRWHFSDVDSAGTQYWWRVYVDDGTTNVSADYTFTTSGPVDMYIQNTVDGQDFIDLKKGEHLNLTVYVETNQMWIDTVEPWEITFTHSLLEGVDSDDNSSNGNVTWGDLFADTIFEKTGTWHNDVGILNGTVRANGDTNTSGDLMFFHFDSGEGTGTAYVNMTVGEVGVAFTDDLNKPSTTVDRPFTVSNLTMFIHYYIPTEPSSFTATTVSQTQIDLSWVKDTTGDYGVDPDDGVGEYVYIERNTVSSWSMGDGTEVYNGTGTSFSDTNVVQGTQYYYQAWSYNDTDNLYSTLYSSDSDTTQSLTPPGDVVVESYDGVMMNLSWTVVDADSNRTYIERRTTPGPWSIGDGTVAYNDTGSSFTDTNLAHNTTYYYQLWSWDEDDGIYSDTFSSGSNTTTVLLAPTGMTADWNDPNKHTQIDLTWNNADGFDSTYIERNTVSTWNRGEGTKIYNNSGTSFTDTGLNQNTQYWYRAWSYNVTEGFSSAFDSATNTTDDFVPPTVLIVTPDDGIKMDLSWDGEIDADADYVYIERSLSPDWTRGDGTEVCNLTVSTTTYKDTDLDHDTTYYYQAWSYNVTENIYSDLNTSESNTTSVLLSPTNLLASPVSNYLHTKINLTWTNADGIDSTYIERHSSPNWAIGTGTEIYNGTDEIFIDTGLSQNTHYYYQAWSWNSTEGYSSTNDSDDLSTEELIPPDDFWAVAQGNATIQLDWTYCVHGGTVLYYDNHIIERSTTQTWVRGTGTEIYNDTGSSYLDDDVVLDHSTQYFYQIWAYNESQKIYSDNYVEVNETTTDLQSPESLTVIWNSSAEHTVQDISWVNNEADSDATVLEYMEGSGSSWNPGEGTELYNDSGLSFVHSGLTQNTLYRYQVWSWNESEGIYSPLFDSAENTTADLISPTDFTASVIDWDGIGLSWNIADDDSDTTYIERSTGITTNTTFYYTDYDTNIAWDYNPEHMVDGDLETSSTPTFVIVDVQRNTVSECDGTDLGTISKVEIGGYCSGGVAVGETYDVILTPVFNGTTSGDTYTENPTRDYVGDKEWVYVDITNDGDAPSTWTWTDVQNLDMEVRNFGTVDNQFEVYETTVRVTYETTSWNVGEGTTVVYNDTGTTFDDTGLDSKTQYYYQAWAYNATENIYSTLYSSDSDTTLNTPPVKPTNVYPTDNSPYCSVYPTYKSYIGDVSNQVATDNLTVYAEDPDGDNLDVEFYWSDGEHIGTVTVASGTNAVLYLDGNISADKSPTASAYQWLKHDTTYTWYAIANDTAVNPGDSHTNTSDSWDFDTSHYSDINENGEVDYLDVSISLS